MNKETLQETLGNYLDRVCTMANKCDRPHVCIVFAPKGSVISAKRSKAMARLQNMQDIHFNGPFPETINNGVVGPFSLPIEALKELKKGITPQQFFLLLKKHGIL